MHERDQLVSPTLDGHRREAIVLYLSELVAQKSVALLDGDDGAARFVVDQGARLAKAGAAVGEGRYDVVLALEVARDSLKDVVATGRRLLSKEGTLVVGGPSRDRPGAKEGVSYFEVLDALEPAFDDVRMVGQAPFFGATLAEYGVTDPDPVIDARLVEKGERVDWYVAIAGPVRGKPAGYAVVQLPAPANGEARAAVPPPPPAELAELRHSLAARERHVDELSRAAQLHAEEMARVALLLDERDAYIGELEDERQAVEETQRKSDEAGRRASQAEAREREARKALAVAEGQLARLNAKQLPETAPPPTVLTPPPPAPPREISAVSGEAAERILALEKENAQLKEKEAEARAESWKALRGRSEAEAVAAQVREDTVRKLKDARKLASVELMRAMEEASRKAVALKDDLERTERERKALKAELAEIKGKTAASDAPPPPAPPVETPPAPPSAEATAIEAPAADPQPTSIVVELTRTAEALKLELAETRAQLEHVRGEGGSLLNAQRESHEQKWDELNAEKERLRQAQERAQVALQHERARSERLMADERRAMIERNEARAQAAAGEATRAAVGMEQERLRIAFEKEQERAQTAEEDVQQKKAKIKKLKNTVEEFETRAVAVERVAEQIGLVESALRGEEIRLTSLEEALRQMAAEPSEPAATTD